jgi:glyoxylase-like metal-dependent hydrolase (beta-lactamase superfamily II)
MAFTTVTYFPVDNGDMSLIALGDTQGTKVLIDCNIRESADDPEDDARDVAKDLRARLKRDSKKRPYLDAFLLSHPDQDHCRGLQKHFYLGPPEDYPDDKKADQEKHIFIRELWSSPLVFRRAGKSLEAIA